MSFGSTPINTGSGANIAKDDVGGVVFQRTKLVDGTEGGTDGIPGDSNGLLVKFVALPELDPRQDYAMVGGSPRLIKWRKIHVTASGDATVIPSSGSVKFRVLSLYMVADTGNDVAFKSGSTVLIDNVPCQAYVPIDMDPARGYVCETAAGEAFVLNFDTGGNVGGYVNYIEI